MTIKVIARLDRFAADPGELSTYEFEHLRFGNSSDVFLGAFNEEHFVKGVGMIDVQDLMEEFCLFSAIDDSVVDEHQAPAFFVGQIQAFLYALWLVKDNAVRTLSVFHEIPEQHYVFKVKIGIENCVSSGEYPTTHFTLQELQEATILHSQISGNALTSREELPRVKGVGVQRSPLHTKPYNDLTRIARATYFVHLAQQSTFIPTKVGFYCSVLESLFGDQGEITHKISERTAIYSEENLNDRIEIYNLVKTAYTLRSNYFHGGTLSKKVRDLQQQISISERMDSLLRKILRKIYSRDYLQFLETDDEKMQKYFQELTLR